MLLWRAPVETPQPLEVSQAAVLADGIARGIFSGAAWELAREYRLAIPLSDRAALHRRGAGPCGLRCRSSIRPGAVRAQLALIGLLFLRRRGPHLDDDARRRVGWRHNDALVVSPQRMWPRVAKLLGRSHLHAWVRSLIDI
eukprot:scaffold4170_cov63-Phaeocystis_antarctica.AAC.22